MPARLHEDHDNARFLAESVAEMDGFTVDLSRVQTNIVMVDIEHMTSGELLERLQSKGILAGPASATQVRFVTHRDVSREDVETAVGCLKELGT
jgi:threonine aldolase